MSFYGPYLFELSFPRPTEQFEGSSFKSLSLLAHHPWVRTSHHRSKVANSDSSMPRLSFLMQYYYLHGEYPPSSADHDDGERENTRTETEEGSLNNHECHFEGADEGSTTSDTISNASDDSSKASHFEIESIGHTTTHTLPYVLRPSCNRSSSSSSSTTSSSSFTFRSRNPRRQSFGTSPNMGLSAFHDVFATSICPSTDILFPVSDILHRGHPKKRRTKSK